ncbi:MAG: zinc ribbon domain-containing protein [Blastocatellia bacterium]|nr:zinc ribbon domain-containing protein [Blastocatellia bacterium]
MTCPKCGAPIAPGLRFCKQCWSPVEGSTAVPHADISTATEEPKPREQRGPLFGVGYNEPAEPASGPLRATSVTPAPLVAPQWTSPALSPSEGKPSSRAIAAMMFGLLSVVLFCGFFFTMPVDLAGIALAFFELRAIARGERPIAGKNLSMIGLVICSIVLAIKAFLLLAVFT